MQIELKEIESCKVAVTYEADPDKISSKRLEVVDAFRKAPVKGFRAGKAPTEAIKQFYRSQIDESVKRAMMESAYHDTIGEKQLRIHGAPQFTSVSLLGDKFVCEFNIHTKPEFETPTYKNLDIPKPHQALTSEEATEKMLQELRVRYGEQVPFSDLDFAESGDNVIIDYEGVLDGQRIESVCAKGESLKVGASQLTEFDQNILGMKIGDTRTFDLKVPEDGLASLAGKTLIFTVSLTTGSKVIPCGLDDSLAQKIGYSTFDELRSFVGSTASAQIARAFKISVNNLVCAKLVESATISVPSWMTLSESQYLAHANKADWSQLSDEDKEKYLQMSERNVKLSLILDRVREEEPDAQLTDEEVFKLVKDTLSAKKDLASSPEDAIKEMAKTGYLQILFSKIRDEHVLDFIAQTVRLIE